MTRWNKERSGRHTGAIGALLLLLLPVLANAVSPRQTDDGNLNAYLKGTPENEITRLQENIDAGQVRLKYDGVRGYLPALLKALDIPVSSQTLVFSRTSFQHERISPRNPRALYFNDQTYVGWVPGGNLVEISTADPKLGAVFYTLSQDPAAKPRLARQTFDCIQCHQGAMTANVPGHIMRSVYPQPDGLPDLASGTYLTGDSSPLSERWGGWYVTGKHGVMRHMGNVVVTSASGAARIDRERGANVTDLSRYFNTDTYLAPDSDIVALMVLQHEINFHNLLTRAAELTKRTLDDEVALYGKERSAGDNLSESARSRIRNAGEPVVRALLFADEPKWESSVRGTSTFTTDFLRRGPHDHLERSLRQFDLRDRLFRYPCSYLIYTPAFEALPTVAKEYIYGRLREVIEGKETGKGFDRLTPAQRQGIREILLETKPEFAAYCAKNA